jgi:GntR family transcriptional regulator, carbon starvation induced regulator
MDALPFQSSDSLAAKAAEHIAAQILAGELQPGERLNIRDLVARTGIGSTPLREGLSRLIARGLVKVIDQRGFRVADMSPADLMDIIRTRLPLEMEALRLSIEHGDDQWEAGIVATLHRLVNYMSWAPEDAREAATGFDSVHKAFHMALISACGSPRMLAFLDVLYDQGFRYRHLMLKNRKPREHLQRVQRIDEHRILAEYSIKRDAARACEILRHHLMTFADDVFPPDPVR